MPNLQTIERGYGKVRGWLTPALAVTLGGAMLAGGPAETRAGESTPRSEPAAVAAVAMGSEVENTVSGRIETLHGEPVEVRNDPSGHRIGRYRDKSEVQIICQEPGAHAPGDPEDFGKPPLADTTWYRLGDPSSGAPFCPERWVPANPVFTRDPVPSCLPR